LAGKLKFTRIFFLVYLSYGFAQTTIDPKNLINELGCGNCHLGAEQSSLIPLRAPDLSSSGSKYNSSFIYDYLKEPHSVRKNIGLSRMPNFNLSDEEAYALTLYLETKTLQSKSDHFNRGDRSIDAFKLINEDYQCTSCHLLNEKGLDRSIDLNSTGARLKEEWIYETIFYPQKHIAEGTSMPMFFDDTNEESKIAAGSMTQYIYSKGNDKLKQLDKKLRKARKKFSHITSELGRQIFLSQNCISCHTMEDETSWFSDHNAPDLSGQAMRTKKQWLLSYLEEPKPIRPYGYFPGTGSRMPNYSLNSDEVNSIMQWIGSFPQKTTIEEISNFQSNKIHNLLENQLSCLGCHQLNEKGGKVGPDLTNAGNRLTDGYIKMAIEHPQMVMPESIMPKQVINKKTTQLLQSFIKMQVNEKNSNPPIYISLVENQPYKVDDIYIANCSVCHGLNGAGDGFNAKYLPISPGNLSDSETISQRSDDTLYETLYNGGRIMKKHHFMPSWGLKLSHSEIVYLVNRIRQLCDCDGLEWSKK
tara:strand:- start:1228 stop:2817 length:1590 start_codon:yes stop_codon:yes gene_type:complete